MARTFYFWEFLITYLFYLLISIVYYIRHVVKYPPSIPPKSLNRFGGYEYSGRRAGCSCGPGNAGLTACRALAADQEHQAEALEWVEGIGRAQRPFIRPY